MSLFENRFGRKKKPLREDIPLVEHPSDDYQTALQAITFAMKELQFIESGDRWINFSGQGRRSSENSTQIVNVPFRGNTFDLRGEKVDVAEILKSAGLTGSAAETKAGTEGTITLPNASPEQLARFLDALFQKHFGITPHEGESDYAVGAEW